MITLGENQARSPKLPQYGACRGTRLGVPIIRTRVFGVLYSVPIFWETETTYVIEIDMLPGWRARGTRGTSAIH